MAFCFAAVLVEVGLAIRARQTRTGYCGDPADPTTGSPPLVTMVQGTPRPLAAIVTDKQEPACEIRPREPGLVPEAAARL
jgi:hypothetical protein